MELFTARPHLASITKQNANRLHTPLSSSLQPHKRAISEISRSRLSRLRTIVRCTQRKPDGEDFKLSRQSYLQGTLALALTIVESSSPLEGLAATLPPIEGNQEDIVIPMEFISGGYFCKFAIEGGRSIRGQLDTGSPFLILDKGSYEDQGQISPYGDTYERYASHEGDVRWDKGTVNFTESINTNSDSGARVFKDVVYGVFQTFVNVGGGTEVIIGLVKNKVPRIRPTFLGQTDLRSMQFDFITNQFTLSRRGLIPPMVDTIPLVDIRQLFNAPVQQFVGKVKSFYINDRLVRTGGSNQPIYAMIDTGTTGLFVVENMFYPLQKESKGWRSAEVDFETSSGKIVTLRASRPSPLFLVFPTKFDWLPPDANLIILGVAFLQDSVLTIDTQTNRFALDVPAA